MADPRKKWAFASTIGPLSLVYLLLFHLTQLLLLCTSAQGQQLVSRTIRGEFNVVYNSTTKRGGALDVYRFHVREVKSFPRLLLILNNGLVAINKIDKHVFQKRKKCSKVFILSFLLPNIVYSHFIKEK